ncbi:MAG: NUDIX hydrolase [Bacillota bacterium]
MLFRSCAGGVVFHGDKVLILKNEKDEWVLPKGVIRNGNLSKDVAVDRVKVETGVTAEILTSIGETCYEFYSYTRQRPVCNEITWYLMKADSDMCTQSKEISSKDVGFFQIDEAVERITHNQDRSLVRLSFKKLKALTDAELMV